MLKQTPMDMKSLHFFRAATCSKLRTFHWAGALDKRQARKLPQPLLCRSSQDVRSPDSSHLSEMLAELSSGVEGRHVVPVLPHGQFVNHPC